MIWGISYYHRARTGTGEKAPSVRQRPYRAEIYYQSDATYMTLYMSALDIMEHPVKQLNALSCLRRRCSHL
jgi:hypothetical protein